MTHEIKPLIPVPKLTDERMEELLKKYLLDPPKRKHICLTDKDLPPIEELVSEEDELTEISNNYINNIKAYIYGEKIYGKYEPDERFMHAIEEKIGVNKNQKDEFRSQILKYIGSLAADNKTFDYKKDEQLKKAFIRYAFDRRKDKIRFDSIIKGSVDEHEQIVRYERVVNLLIKDFGYCKVCAVDALASYIKRDP